jgi:hypothetical protein
MAAIAHFKIRSDFTARKIRGLSIFSVGLSHGEKKVLEWKGNAARLSNDAANQPSSPSSLVLPLDYPKKVIASSQIGRVIATASAPTKSTYKRLTVHTI